MLTVSPEGRIPEIGIGHGEDKGFLQLRCKNLNRGFDRQTGRVKEAENKITRWP